MDLRARPEAEPGNLVTLTTLRRVLGGCSRALIIAFRQLHVSKGTWRSGTAEARERIRSAAVHWCHSVRAARGSIVKPLDDPAVAALRAG